MAGIKALFVIKKKELGMRISVALKNCITLLTL